MSKYPAELIHYSRRPLNQPLRNITQVNAEFKPHGLWLSVDSSDPNWKTWCESEEFALAHFNCKHEVFLHEHSDILQLCSAEDIDSFTQEYGILPPNMLSYTLIRWADAAKKYQGIIISPYIWERRTVDWYYGWDCASGCIWDVSAISHIQPR